MINYIHIKDARTGKDVIPKTQIGSYVTPEMFGTWLPLGMIS